MRVQSQRFGEFQVGDNEAIEFARGLVGFPNARAFVLLRKSEESPIGWLQSTEQLSLAIPVVSVEALANDVPVSELADAVNKAGLDADLDQCAIMAVLCAPGRGSHATVNLLAPIVVNAKTRRGAQVILENSTLTTQEPFLLTRQVTSRIARVSVGKHQGANLITATSP